MSDKEIYKDSANINPEPIIKDLVNMARKLKSEEEADCVRAAKEFPEYPYIPTIDFQIPKEGSPMKELTKKVSEFLFQLRKMYGMYSQIMIEIVCVTPEKITVIIKDHRPDADEERLVWGIRDGFLSFLQDLLPCPFFQGIYFNRSKREYAREYFLPFYDENAQESLYSPVNPVEENLKPHRERFRPTIKELWDKLEQFLVRAYYDRKHLAGYYMEMKTMAFVSPDLLVDNLDIEEGSRRLKEYFQ